MPPTAATLRVGRYFLSLLIVLIVLFGLVFLPGQRHTPKLGLDLEGGKQITLQAKQAGGGQPSASSMAVARSILTDRVNGKGVSAAEVVQEGSDRIVISVPGKSTSDLSGIEKSAQLNFRPLVMPPVAPPVAPPVPATPSLSGGAGSSGSASATPASTGGKAAPRPTTAGPVTSPGGVVQPLLAPSTSAATTGRATSAAPATSAATAKPTASAPAGATPAATPTARASTPAVPPAAAALPELQDPFTGLGFALPTSDTAFSALTTTQQSQLAAALQRFKCGSKPPDIPTKPLAACDSSGLKYLLGPVIVSGSQIQTASAQAPNANQSQWQVSLTLKDSGDKVWSAYTKAHHSQSGAAIQSATTCSVSTVPCAEYVGFTLDGDVVEAPHNEATISGTPTSITGNFTQKTATNLANELKYGALPLSLSVLTNSDVSATLGAGQLKAGLLAGGIGLILVVIYSLLYYRALGLVTIASLLVSGGLTYGCLVVLGREMGFTLTLAGIAGFIVAVGITADSFVVLFERLKDEIHGGRSMRVAVPRAWTRARRTILSADTVSFLAAAVLYYFAAGDVRGFAFTLGLSTVLDLVVVFLFTHPLVSLLSRSRAFGSARFTGLNAVRTGGPLVVPAARVPRVGSRLRRGHGGASALGADVLQRDVDEDDETLDDVPSAEQLSAAERDVSGREAMPETRAQPPAATRTAPIAASAAERAAARRGRAVRPQPPETVVDDEASAEEVEPDGLAPLPTAGTPPPDNVVVAAGDQSAPLPTHTEPGPDVVPAPPAPTTRAASAVAPIEPAVAADLRPAAPPAPPGPPARAASLSEAGQRAAARRARIRSRAGTPQGSTPRNEDES